MALTESIYAERVYRHTEIPDLLEYIRPTDKKVLDVGAGAGGNARLLKSKGLDVVALTVSSAEARELEPICPVYVCDIETSLPDFAPQSFDVILCSHVLEHLRQPEGVLRQLSSLLVDNGHLIVVLPNVMYWRQRIKFLMGHFEYSKDGLMDETHLHFFDYWTAARLVDRSGYRVTIHKAIGSVPLWPLRKWVGRNTWLDKLGCRLFPNLFGWHILVLGEKPSVIGVGSQ